MLTHACPASVQSDFFQPAIFSANSIFYRMYQKERMGEPVDFTYLAKRSILAHEARGKSYKLESENNKHTPESKLREIARNYQDDYARWKIVYSPRQGAQDDLPLPP